MKYYNGMEKDRFLRYVYEHSKTPRALFNKEMVAQLCELNGDHEDAEEIANGIKNWYSLDLREYVDEIRLKNNTCVTPE